MRIASRFKSVPIVLSLAMTGCTAVGNQISDIVFVPNPNSDRRTEEDIVLDIAYSTNLPPPVQAFEEDKAGEGRGIVAGMGAPSVADIAIAQVSRILTAEAERYTASYSAEASGDAFYHDVVPLVGAQVMTAARVKAYSDVKFAGFKLTRYVRENGADKDSAALAVCAIALPSRDDGFIQIVPVSYEMRYAKVKLVAFDFLSPFGVDLFNPWEALTNPINGIPYQMPPGDQAVDLTIGITMGYMHLTQDGVKATDVGPMTISLKNVRVLGRAKGGLFPAYKRFVEAKGDDYHVPCTDEVTPARLAAVRDLVMKLPVDDHERLRLGTGATLFPVAPRSIEGSEGQGHFTLRVEVTEFDDYGARIKEIGTTFEENKGSIQQRLNSFFDG